jgi:hypothetical protein
MIPTLEGIEIIDTLPEVPTTYATKTYKIDWLTQSISGYVDEVEALRQSIYCILNTERYQHNIYSYDYGGEFKEIIGEEYLFICADLHRRVEEALLQDDRITSVAMLNIVSEGENVYYEGNVSTVFGEIEINKEVL